MKRYYKEEDGKRIWLGQILKINGKQIINPSEEQILSAGYVLYTPPTPSPLTDEELLERAKNDKIWELKNYDESEEVNDCIISYNGEEIHYWAKVKERTELKNTVRDCIAVGRDMYRLDLRDKGISIMLPCEVLLQMLAALEITWHKGGKKSFRL